MSAWLSRSPIPSPHAGRSLEALSRRFRLPIADLALASAQAVALVPEKWARRFHIVPLSATGAGARDRHGRSAGRRLRAHARLRDGPARAPRARRHRTRSRERIDELYRGERRDARAGVGARRPASRQTDESAPPIADRGEQRRRSRISSTSCSRRESRRARATFTSSRKSRASPFVIAWTECSRWRDAAARRRAGARVAYQDSLGARHRRSAATAGWPRARRDQRRRGRPARSTLPASHGEKVVIRVLDGRSTVLTLEGMGFHADELERIEQSAAMPRRSDSRHRTDGLGKDDHALRRASTAQGARREHRHGRGPDRVSAAGNRAGPGEREGRV